ncbi:MAG TPA: chemotaxis protein CheA [Spirochaetota bacterium]|nr:chemotaxis protein CheA [Spirochaetota bacterium]HPF05102.1 chemotaxis protein CheA [Spirochaetota bacterium]HPJ41507.1 chemotaxis protein CheA [Spirochaetota bacterium]HPR37712.1 chemotaxis protein CheA [Spirochaetota bacterium]HRX46561.1 chemotaxis protein CheA [Spirochaetota bacterium]
MDVEALRDVFREEASELLSQMEMPLIELEGNPSDSELINTVFRALHTIKGSGSMCGYKELAGFTHDLENLFDCMRKGRFSADERIVRLSLKAKDCMKFLLDGIDNEEQKALRGSILQEVRDITGDISCDEKKHEVKDTPEVVPAGSSDEPGIDTVNDSIERYRIVFMPSPDILSRGIKIEPMLSELSALGDFKVRVDISSIPDFDDMEPEQCYLSWVVDLETSKDVFDIKNVFMFTEDYAEVVIKYRDGFFLNNAFFRNEEEKEGLEKKVSPMLSLMEGRSKQDARQEKIAFDRRRADTTSIRVKNEKLDTLVNLVGELVTLQARLNQESAASRLPEFISIAENFGRLTNELRDNTMSIRMVPISETFNSFHRLVHDLSGTLGKKIKLITTGGETELDKNVIEALRDPLMHIIRNSCDHGIETVEKRIEQGKDETGLIQLVAEHAGANVVIRISDDGGGLNKEKIKTRAIERDLLPQGEYDDRQIYSMIFEPGFSTAEVTTDISGRGVGMDVVKRNIEKLRGSIVVESVEGTGTSISLTIPLTLAIIDGFMVELGGSPYIFNLTNIRECLDFSSSVERDEGSNFMINLRGDIVPCIDLRNVFGYDDKEAAYPQVVISEIAEERYGFLVDRVIGKYQTVVKPLGRGSRNIDMIAGATILGDGTVALILDAHCIVRSMSGSAKGNLPENIIRQ